MRWTSRALENVPRPTDRPFASVHGTPVLECVAFGNGALSGWGVASHQLGLVGAIARSLSRRFGRGVTVRGTIDPDLTVRSMLAVAASVPWGSAQVGVLAFGPDEIRESPDSRAWAQDLERLIADIRGRMPAGSTLAVLGIPPLGALSFLQGVGGPLVGRLIERYNARAATVCAAFEGVQFVPLPEPGAPQPDTYRSSAHYTFWGDVIGAFVGWDAAEAEPPRTSVAERSRSAESTGLLDGSRQTERFDRIVRLARSVFRTTSAAFTRLHEDSQWSPARVGLEPERLPRDQSICDIAVGQAAPLVIGDTWSDDRFDANPVVREGSGIRFYAGYPLRAPDGNLIGALCVFDPAPRDADDVDVATLRDLALMIEAELLTP
jgi:hypothetical protein